MSLELLTPSIGTAQLGKAPVLVDDLKLMLNTLPETRVGLRDRALLLLGFAGAFRRSELVSLDVADLEFVQTGLIVTLRNPRRIRKARVADWAFRTGCPRTPARSAR